MPSKLLLVSTWYLTSVQNIMKQNTRNIYIGNNTIVSAAHFDSPSESCGKTAFHTSNKEKSSGFAFFQPVPRKNAMSLQMCNIMLY